MRPLVRRGALVAGAVLLAAALTAPSGQADAPVGGSAEVRREQVLGLVKQYFIARDKGWLTSQTGLLAARQSGGGSSGSRSSRGSVGAQPLLVARSLARIADEAAGQRGLRAVKVRTGFGPDQRVDFSERAATGTATATLTTGTYLAWNDRALKATELSDTYTVRLRHDGRKWKLTRVSYAPVPSTDGIQAPDKPDRGKGPRRSAGPRAGTYNRAAAAAYANKWSGQWRKTSFGMTFTQDAHNPDYDHFDNDCANFASQVLHAGGWPMKHGKGWFQDPADPLVWSSNVSGIRGASRTWTQARSLHRYATDPARGQAWKAGLPGDTNDIWKLRPGDLLFSDWDPNGRFDGHIDHAMVISGTFTELGFTEPTYSQHSPHRKNVPLSIGIKIATATPPRVEPGGGMGGQGRAVILHPVHVKDSYTG
ncbi:amidase domain-containing protein [Streptomyces sp. NPDC051214]|uniref:amidase domain-containing protein n=1 Tax=Streptomyces sp. NPDC051214 TaxID=3155282 RepID=UPI003445198C